MRELADQLLKRGIDRLKQFKCKLYTGIFTLAKHHLAPMAEIGADIERYETLPLARTLKAANALADQCCLAIDCDTVWPVAPRRHVKPASKTPRAAASQQA